MYNPMGWNEDNYLLLRRIEGLENMVFYGFALLILVMVVMMMAMTCSLKRRGYNKVYSGDTDLE